MTLLFPSETGRPGEFGSQFFQHWVIFLYSLTDRGRIECRVLALLRRVGSSEVASTARLCYLGFRVERSISNKNLQTNIYE